MPESLIYQSSTPSYFHHNMNSLVEDHGYYINAHDITYPMAVSSSPYLIDDAYTLDLHTDVDNMDIVEYLKDPIVEINPVSVLYHNNDTTKRHSNTEQRSSSSSVMVNSAENAYSSLVLPNEEMEIDNEVGVFHLLMAYSEAVEMKQDELAKVIIKRISDKVSLVGDIMERLMYYMFHINNSNNKQQYSGDYLKQESIKNFYLAFKAFYQIYPNGKFAHFTANSAILEALPNDIEVVRIFDFDIGEGIQWASIIQTLANTGVQVMLTSVKFDDDDDDDDVDSMWRFEETKKRLSDYGRLLGIHLKVEEIELCDLEIDLKGYIKTKEGIFGRSTRRDFFVFNCMSCLPHMGKLRSKKEVNGFLQIAQDFLLTMSDDHSNRQQRRGIITLGDGDAVEKKAKTNTTTYSGFLDIKMMQYQALLESMKMNFPQHLAEARIAMECLFVAPFVSCNAWAKEWDETKSRNPDFGIGLEGWKMSQENLMEAQQVVKEGESSYGVRIEGERNNEMVMDWRGIPMVRVSCWRN